MFHRKIWFLFFYLILLIFVVYSVIYLFIIWNNQELYNLFNYHFIVDFTKSNTVFSATSRFQLFYLPIIGTALAIIGFFAVITSQSTLFTKIKVNQRLWLLITSFSIVMIGFFVSFIAQLFYNQWDNSTIFITITSSATQQSKSAIDYYHNWFTVLQMWIVFGIFFGIFVLCLVLCVKLYLLNLQWYNYLKKDTNENQKFSYIPRYKKDNESLQFNPHQTKTITIILDPKTGAKNKKSQKKLTKSSKIKKK